MTKRLCIPFWRSTVSSQWPNVSVPLSDDLMCPTSDKTSQYSFSDDLLCLTSNQHSSLAIYCIKRVTEHLSTPSLTIYCVQSVAKRLSIPLWRSMVAIFYWFSFGTKPLSVTVPDIQWRIWRNGWHYLKRPLSMQRSRSFILVPINSSYTTSYRLSIVTFALVLTV